MSNPEQGDNGGYVYILTNPKMPSLVKIGSTRLHPAVRARQLSSSTGVPAQFQVIAFHRFEDELRAERELQAMFSQHRVDTCREFYELTVKEAQEALLNLSNGKVTTVSDEVSSSPYSAPGHPKPERDHKPMSNTNASVLGFPYWSRFNEMRAEHKLLPRFENAGPRFFHRHFLVSPSQRNGKRNIHHEGRIRINTPQISMRLIFKTAENIKELFDLLARDRDQIDHEIGFPLLWLRDRGQYESHIVVERDDMDPRDVGDWDRQHSWLSDVVSSFEKVLRPRVARLPLAGR